MLCLKCGTDNQGPGPVCHQCGFFIGYVADSGGFMPQLRVLKSGLKDGTVTPEVAHDALHRLEEALQVMMHNVDQTGAGLAAMGLDENQTGVLAGFMFPMRDAMEKFYEAIKALESTDEIPDAAIERLEKLQIDISRGSEGVAYLIQTLHGFLVEKVAAGEQLDPLPTHPPAE